MLRPQHADGEGEETLAGYGKRAGDVWGEVGRGKAGLQGVRGKGECPGEACGSDGRGLLRSAGGWEGVKALREGKVYQRNDERNLGGGDFVGAFWRRPKRGRKSGMRSDSLKIKFITEAQRAQRGRFIFSSIGRSAVAKAKAGQVPIDEKNPGRLWRRRRRVNLSNQIHDGCAFQGPDREHLRWEGYLSTP
jgi:hypothetical protein